MKITYGILWVCFFCLGIQEVAAQGAKNKETMRIEEVSEKLLACKEDSYYFGRDPHEDILAYEKKFDLKLPEEIKWFVANIGEMNSAYSNKYENQARHFLLVLDDLKALGTLENIVLHQFDQPANEYPTKFDYIYLEEGLVPIGIADLDEGGSCVLALSKRNEDFGTIWLAFKALRWDSQERRRSSIKLADNLADWIETLKPNYEELEEQIEELRAQTLAQLVEEYTAIQEQPTQTKTAQELLNKLISGEEIIYNKAQNVAFRYVESTSGNQVHTMDDMKRMAEFETKYQPPIQGSVRKNAQIGKVIAMEEEYGWVPWTYDPIYFVVEIHSEIEGLKNKETFILHKKDGFYSLLRRWRHEAKGYRINHLGTFVLENGNWETQKKRKYPMLNTELKILAVDMTKSELDKELPAAKKHLLDANLEEKILKLIYHRYRTIDYPDFEQMDADDKEYSAEYYPELTHWKDAYLLFSHEEGSYSIYDHHSIWLPYLPDSEHGITLKIENGKLTEE